MNFDVVNYGHRSKRSHQGPDGGYEEFDFGLSYPYGFVTEGVREEPAIKGAAFLAINAATGDAGFPISRAEFRLPWNDTACGGWRPGV